MKLSIERNLSINRSDIFKACTADGLEKGHRCMVATCAPDTMDSSPRLFQLHFQILDFSVQFIDGRYQYRY